MVDSRRFPENDASMRRPPDPRPLLTSLAAAMACGDAGSAGHDASTAESTTSAVETTEPTPTSGLTQSGESTGDGTASASATGTSTTSVTTSTGSSSTAASASGTSTGDGSTGAELCSPHEPAPEDVPLNEACVPQQMGAFEPVIEWKFGDGGFFGPQIVGPAIDTNGSGALDAGDLPHVFIYEYGEVVAVRGDGSGVVWMTAGGKYKVGVYGAVALGDLEGDGWNEVVTAVLDRVCVLDGRDGAEKWCTMIPADSCDDGGYNNPSIADMDGDGLAEVIVGSAILDSTGTIIGVGALGHGGAPIKGDPLKGSIGDLSVAVDLDADGVLELVAGDAAYDLDGNTIWSNGSIDGHIAVADFDLDGAGEIVKTSGIHVFGMESDGSIAWGPVTSVDTSTKIGPPAIGDLDGDGTPELVYGARLGLVAREWGGAELWTAKIDDFSGAAGPVLFDFEGDGYPEVVMADETALRVFNGLDGALKFVGGKHISSTALETPIVVDVDGDGHVEIVLAHSSGTISHGSISVLGDAGDTWPSGRKIWNQHAVSHHQCHEHSLKSPCAALY